MRGLGLRDIHVNGVAVDYPRDDPGQSAYLLQTAGFARVRVNGSGARFQFRTSLNSLMSRCGEAAVIGTAEKYGPYMRELTREAGCESSRQLDATGLFVVYHEIFPDQ